MDSLSRILQINCSWIQLANPVSHQLRLVSCRSFTAEIEREIAQMDIHHVFGQEIVGLGNSIIIPNLSRDGSYGMSVFERDGFRSLIAVPIMTYTAIGIMGGAYRERKRLSNDFTHLFTVIANLLGMALNKQFLIEHTEVSEKVLKTNKEPITSDNAEESFQESETAIYQDSAINSIHRSKDKHETFKQHAGKMSTFRKSHGT